MTRLWHWLWNLPDNFVVRVTILLGFATTQMVVVLVGALTWRYAQWVCR